MNNKVSVIMPTFNRGYIIENAIQSVLSQTYRNFELIIVDDGSSDNTEEIISNFADSRIKYRKFETNCGVSHARNVGLSIAEGEYISFLDSDNKWHESFLEKRLDVLDKTGCNFAFGRMKLKKVDGTTELVPNLVPEELKTHRQLIKLMVDKNIIDMNTVCIEKGCFEKIRFNESMKAVVDWDYFFRGLCQDGVQPIFVDDVLVFNYLQDNSITLFDEKTRLEMYLIMLKSSEEQLRKRGLLKDKISNVYQSLLTEYSVHEALKKLSAILCYDDLIDFVADIINEEREMIQRKREELRFSRNWISSNLQSGDLKSYFASKQVKNVCIYGYSLYGKQLERIIKDCDVELSQVIDRNMDKLEHGSGPEYRSTYEKGLGEDLIIVASSRYFDEIKDELAAVCDTKIISIEELL